MPFEDLKVQINLLLEQMTHQPEDLHELQESVREKLSELKALGQPLPQDLVDLEQHLEDRLQK
jgi:predicted  nucleic acid-binding Zn-ribbon protein